MKELTPSESPPKPFLLRLKQVQLNHYPHLCSCNRSFRRCSVFPFFSHELLSSCAITNKRFTTTNCKDKHYLSSRQQLVNNVFFASTWDSKLGNSNGNGTLYRHRSVELQNGTFKKAMAKCSLDHALCAWFRGHWQEKIRRKKKETAASSGIRTHECVHITSWVWPHGPDSGIDATISCWKACVIFILRNNNISYLCHDCTFEQSYPILMHLK